ncbi:MAG: CopD family protein [Armatimonadota bacterium]
MPLTRDLIAAFVLITASLFGGTPQADAHAVLERSDPPAYRLVLKPPESFTLFFSEPIDGRRTDIRVLDQDGRSISQQSFQVSGDQRRARLPVRLPGPGIYTVSWRTLSLVDQHTYEGFFTITVGPLRPGSFILRAGAAAVPSPWEVAARWLMFLGAAVLGGGFLIHRFLLPPAVHSSVSRPAEDWVENLQHRWRAAAWLGATGFVLGAIGELALQAMRAAQAAGESLGASLVLVATAEPVRTSLLFKIAVPLGLLILAWRAGPAIEPTPPISHSEPGLIRKATASAELLMLALLPLGISLSGHAAAAQSPLPLFADWLHLLSAALWVGGLLHVATVLRPALARVDGQERITILGSLVPRFSNLAFVSVAVLVATGIYATWVNVPGLSAVPTTTYGRTLAIKLVLLVPLLTIAAVNLLSTRPRLVQAARSGTAGTVTATLHGRFFRLIRAESVLASSVLLVAATLALLPTSRQVQALSPFGGPFVLVRKAAVLNTRLQIDPYQVGENTFTLTLQDHEGAPVRDARVRFTFTPLSGRLGTASAEAGGQGDGHFVLSGAYIGTRGPWTITVTVRLRGKEDAQFLFPVEPDWARGTPIASPTDPQAFALLRAGDDAMNRLRGLRQRQDLTDGLGGSVTTVSEFAAPDAMRFQVVGGLEGVFLGERRFLNEGGAWRQLEGLDAPFKFPNSKFARNAESVLFGPREMIGNSQAQAVVFVLRSGGAKARYVVWIDEKSRLIVREAMVAPGHYMLSHNHDFNAPVKISPPFLR